MKVSLRNTKNETLKSGLKSQIYCFSRTTCDLLISLVQESALRACPNTDKHLMFVHLFKSMIRLRFAIRFVIK